MPVGNGLRDDAFWIVTEHGYGADYVKNIQHDPRMRVKVGRHWHHGTAHILTDDDPRRWLRRPVNDALLLLIGTQQLTIRVDLASHSTPPLRPWSPSDQVSARSDGGAGTLSPEVETGKSAHRSPSRGALYPRQSRARVGGAGSERASRLTLVCGSLGGRPA